MAIASKCATPTDDNEGWSCLFLSLAPLIGKSLPFAFDLLAGYFDKLTLLFNRVL